MTTTLDLTGFERRTMRDLFGGHEFPAIGTEGTLTLTLRSHGFYWLRVRPLREDGEPMTETTTLPVLGDPAATI